MRNVDIEGEAVSKLMELARRDPLLEPAIITSDSSPIWDGEIRIYSKPRGLNGFESESFSARVPVQVKGKSLPKDSFPDNLIFKVDKKYLNGFSKDKGAIFFVVLIKDNYERTVYFYEFLPIVLKEINRLLGNKKSKNLSFKKLEENEGDLRHLLINFNDNANRQISNVRYSIPLEKANLEKGSILFHYTPKKNIRSQSELLDEMTSSNLKLSMYYKTEIGIEIPLEDSMADGYFVAKETINEPFIVEGKSFFKKYTRTFTKDEIHIQFDNCIVLKMKKNKSDKIGISLIGAIDERILGLEFLIELRNSKSKNNNRTESKMLEFYYKYKKLIIDLNLKDVFPNGQLQIEDEIAIETVFNALIKKEISSNIVEQSINTLITFKIANEKVILIAVTRDKGHVLYGIEEIGPIKFAYDEGREWLVSGFLMLQYHDFNAVNLNFQKIEECVLQAEKDNPINEDTSEIYNKFMLNLIKAYDEDNSKNHLIQFAERIANRLMLFENNNINILNYLQIEKRIMNSKDFYSLITKNNLVPSSLEEKIAYKILMDKGIKKEMKELEEQSNERFRTFIDYPIFKMHNKSHKN